MKFYIKWINEGKACFTDKPAKGLIFGFPYKGEPYFFVIDYRLRINAFNSLYDAYDYIVE